MKKNDGQIRQARAPQPKQPKPEAKKKGKRLPGVSVYKSMSEYRAHLEDTLGKMHLVALNEAAGGRG